MGSQTIANFIGQQDWLEDAGSSIAELIRSLFPGAAGQATKDALHGTWLGHPLHPVLTDVPVGAWTVALVLDALEGLSGNEDVGGAADAAVAVGIVGALGSAVTGATDWSETYGRAQKVGLVHGALNVVATGLYATSLFMRRGGDRQGGVALSMLGYAVASASAYLGGHLVFGEQIGVDHTATADADKPEDYTPVLPLADLAENKPTRVQAGSVAVLLVRRGERIFAITETCPHLGGPLSEGKLVGDAIECPWHHSQLALEDGSIVNGPTTYPARCFDVRVRDGWISVRAASEHAAQ